MSAWRLRKYCSYYSAYVSGEQPVQSGVLKTRELSKPTEVHGIIYSMKYASVFATIVLIWIAVILMAATRSVADEIFKLYVTAIVSTLALFLIVFARR